MYFYTLYFIGPHGDYVSLAAFTLLGYFKGRETNIKKVTNLPNVIWRWKCRCHSQNLNHMSFSLALISVYQWIPNSGPERHFYWSRASL